MPFVDGVVFPRCFVSFCFLKAKNEKIASKLNKSLSTVIFIFS